MAAIPHTRIMQRGPASASMVTRTKGAKDVSTMFPNFRPQKSINKQNEVLGRRTKVLQMEDRSNMRRGGIVLQTRTGGIHDLPKQHLQRRERAAAMASSRLVPMQILDPVNAEAVSGERVPDPTAPSAVDAAQIRAKNRSEIQRIHLRLETLRSMPPSNERNAEIMSLREQAKGFTGNLRGDSAEGIQPIPSFPVWNPNDNESVKKKEPVPTPSDPAPAVVPPSGGNLPANPIPPPSPPRLPDVPPPRLPDVPPSSQPKEDKQKEAELVLPTPSSFPPHIPNAIQYEPEEEYEEEEGEPAVYGSRKRKLESDYFGLNDQPNHKRGMLKYSGVIPHEIEMEHLQRQRAIDAAARDERHQIALRAQAKTLGEYDEVLNVQGVREMEARQRTKKKKREMRLDVLAHEKDVDVTGSSSSDSKGKEKEESMESMLRKRYSALKQQSRELKVDQDIPMRLELNTAEGMALLQRAKRDPSKIQSSTFQISLQKAITKIEEEAKKKGAEKPTSKGKRYVDNLYNTLKMLRKQKE